MAKSCYFKTARRGLKKVFIETEQANDLLNNLQTYIRSQIKETTPLAEKLDFAGALLEVGTDPMIYMLFPESSIFKNLSNIEEINQFLTKTLTPENHSSSGEESKIDNLDPDSESKIIQDSRSTFITDVYGGRSAARAAMEVKFKQLLNSFIWYDAKNDQEISTQTDVDNSITQSLENLYQEFRNHVVEANFTGARSLPVSLMNGYVQGNWQNIQEIVAFWGLFSNLKPSGVNQLYNEARSSDANINAMAKHQLGAFQAYFILNNFDKLITAMFPKLINIAEDVYGQMVRPSMGNSRSKYILDLTNENVSSSWSSDEDLSDAVAESSAATKIFWESQLLYRRSGDKAEAITTMSLQEVALLWNRLMGYKFYSTDPISYENVIAPLLDLGYLTSEDVATLTLGTNDFGTLYKSFSDLAFEAEYNPKALRMIFKLAASDTVDAINGLHLTKEQKDLAYSIYQQVFNENSTVYSAFTKNRLNKDSDYNSQVKDFYNHIIHFFTTTKQIPMSQSKVLENGSYETKTLGETALDNSAYGFAGLIDASLSATSEVEGKDAEAQKLFKNTKTKDFNTFTLDRSGLEEETVKDKHIDLLLPNDVVLRISSNLVPSLGKVGNKTFTSLAKDFNLVNNIAIQNAVFETLGLQRFGSDAETLLNVTNQSGLTDYDLVTLAANVLYNYGISCNLLGKSLTAQQYESEAHSYYNNGSNQKPRIQKDGTDLKGINDNYTGSLRNLVKSIDIINGVLREAMVKGADGKMINTITLNQLFATASDQWHRERQNPNSACNGFGSLYDSYVGEEFARDVITNSGNEKTSEFTPAENFAFNFVADYLAGMYPEEHGESIMRVIPLVISDKTRLPKIKINLNAINPIIGKSWKDCTYDEIKETYKQEIGGYYNKLFNVINQRFAVLSEQAANNTLEEDGVTIHLETGTFGNTTADTDVRDLLATLNGGLNPSTNFAEFNEAIDNFKINALAKVDAGYYNDSSTPEYEVTKRFAVEAAKKYDADAYTILTDITSNVNSKYLDEFNTFIRKDINNRAEAAIENVLHELTLRAYKNGNDVKITSNSHYMMLNGHLQVNIGLVDQLYRWGYLSKAQAEVLLPQRLLETGHGTSEKYFSDKSEQFLREILQDDGYIRLKNKNAQIKEGALNKIKNQTILPNVTAYSDGKLVLGVISYVGIKDGAVTTFHERLTDKTRFKKSFILKQTFNYLKYNEVPELAAIVANFDSASDWFDDPSFNFNSFVQYFNDALKHDYALRNNPAALEIERDNRIAKVTQSFATRQQQITETINNSIITLKQELVNVDENSRQYKKLESNIDRLQKKLVNSIDAIQTQATERINAITEDFTERIKKADPNAPEIGDFGVVLTINPELKKFNLLSMLFGQEYTIATVGTHLNHPGKNAKNLQAFEANAWGQQVKRNVTMSATKHAYRLNQLNGLPAVVKQMIITNLRDDVYNITGTQDEVFNDDGACYVPGVTHYFENASLNGDAVGVDKKTFFHMHDAETGTGYIGKDAGFTATNNRVRNSNNFYKYLNYRALFHGDLSSHFINGGIDITKNYKGGKITFGDFVYKRVEDSNSRLNLEITLADGTPINLNNKLVQVDGSSITFNNGHIDFKATVSEEDGTATSVNLTTVLTNAYQIWQFFGGAYSGSLDAQQNLVFNEDSVKRLAFLCNELGTIRTEPRKFITTVDGVETEVTEEMGETPLSQLDVDQWLKKSIVMYFPTKESVKQGTANVNDSSMLTNLDYSFVPMNLEMYDSGVQLNAEHHADDTVISMMTQVINALGARGYTAEDANKVFQALRSLTAINLASYIDSLGSNSQTARAKLEDFLTRIIARTIASGSALDEGTLAGALVYQAKKLIDSGNGLTYKDVQKLIPMDDVTLLKAEMSKIASTLVKSCIKLKFPGSMDVLSPSNGRFLLYNNKMEGEYQGDFSSLEELDNNAIPHRRISDVELGKTYRIYNTQKISDEINPVTEELETTVGENEFIAGEQRDGYVLFKVNTPTDYWLLKNFLVSHQEATISESLASGRDLASYNIKFKDTEGNQYNIWDIKEIKDLYNQSLNDPTHRQELRTSLQVALNALSNDPNYTQATVIDANNVEKTVVIDKDNVEVVPYELIMSMHDKKQFGLKTGDSVQEISQDKLFFLKRQLQEFKDGINDDYFDIKLQALTSDDDLYLAFNDKPVDSSYWTERDFVPYKDENGKLWLLNNLNQKVQQLYSENDKIYKGKGGEMLIVTDNVKDYIENTSHSNVTISSRIGNRDTKTVVNIVESQLLPCEDKGIKKFLQRFKNTLTKQAIDEDTTVEQGEISQYLENLSNEEFAKLFSDFVTVGRENFLTALNVAKNIVDLNSIPVEQKIDSLLGKGVDGTYNVKNYRVRSMVENALKTHTSFLKSLEVLAARIPAQCMQSFMSMKIAGFDDSGLNTAYVSRFQIYLQGSDFDIDKVSLLGFKFRNGRFITWSPYMDLGSKALLEASINLPFPSGRSSEVLEDSEKHCSLGDDVIYGIKDYIQDNVNIVTDSNGVMLFSLNPEKEVSTEFENLPTRDEIWKQFNSVSLQDNLNGKSLEEKIKAIKKVDSNFEGTTEAEADAAISELNKTPEEFIDYCNTLSGKSVRTSVVNARKAAIAYIEEAEKIEGARKASSFSIAAGKAWTPENATKILRILNSKIATGQKIITNEEEVKELLAVNGYTIENAADSSIATKVNAPTTAANDFLNYIKNNNDLFVQSEGVWKLNLQANNEVDQVKLLKKLARFIGVVNNFGGMPRLNSDSTEATVYNDSIEGILEAIDKHNLSLNKNKHNLQDALINFVSSTMYNVGKNPANQIQAQSSVDASDGSVKIIKKVAAPLPYSKRLNTYDPGSMSSLYRMMALTLGGKTNTGIVASSLKVFETLSQYTYNTLNSGTPEETLGLLVNRQIAGTTVNMLANAHQQNKQNALPTEVIEALQNVNQTVDAYLNFSGFLSLSTDNAKDPTLPKINAGSKMIGLYLSGLSAGCDIQTLVALLTSKAGLRINDLMNKNLFNMEDGLFDVDAVLNYLDRPSKLLQGISKGAKDELIKLWEAFNPDLAEDKKNRNKGVKDYELISFVTDPAINKRVINNLKELRRNLIKGVTEDEALDTIADNVDKAEATESKTSFASSNNTGKLVGGLRKLINKIEDFMNLKNEITKCYINLNGEVVNAFKQIVELNRLHSEMRCFSPIGRLNQDLPNSIDEQIVWKRKFEKGIETRLKHMTEAELRSTEVKEAKEALAKLNQETIPESSNEEADYSVDFVQFVENENYRNEVIRIYDALKYCVNIYGAMYKLPNYFGYMQALAAQYKVNSATSNIYKAVDNLTRYFIPIKGSEQERQRKVSKLIDWLSDEMTSSFMLEYFTTPVTVQPQSGESISRYLRTSQSTHIELGEATSEPFKILLGTNEGNNTFKYVMEEKVLKALQSDPVYQHNPLVRALTFVKNTQTSDGNSVRKIALQTSGIPNTEYENNKLSEYKYGLDLMANVQIPHLGGMNFVDALFAYNLIVNKGKATQSSLTNLFEGWSRTQGETIEDPIAKGGESYGSAFIKAYYDYRKIKSEQLLEKYATPSQTVLDKIQMALAPFDSQFKSGEQYIYVNNPSTRRKELLEKVTEVENDYSDDGFMSDNDNSNVDPEDYGVEVSKIEQYYDNRLKSNNYQQVGATNNLRIMRNFLTADSNSNSYIRVNPATSEVKVVTENGNHITAAWLKEHTRGEENKKFVEGKTMRVILEEAGMIDANGNYKPLEDIMRFFESLQNDSNCL